jgi:hypothetical protein
MPVMTETQKSSTMFTLPPLILHPFSSTEDSSVLTESSRASLVMQGLLPDSGQSSDDLDRSLLRGRYAELRMLFYVGKDLTRWLEQCVEVAGVDEELSRRSLTRESFVCLLVQRVPPAVRRKLETWGVLDFPALFRRALGVHIVFSEPPPLECLNPDFLRRYHRYIDQWFDLSIQQRAIARCNDDEFTYDLYASGEYTQMLEQNWKS